MKDHNGARADNRDGMTFEELLEKVPAEYKVNVVTALKHVLEFIAEHDYKNVSIGLEAVEPEEQEDKVWH